MEERARHPAGRREIALPDQDGLGADLLHRERIPRREGDSRAHLRLGFCCACDRLGGRGRGDSRAGANPAARHHPLSPQGAEHARPGLQAEPLERALGLAAATARLSWAAHAGPREGCPWPQRARNRGRTMVSGCRGTNLVLLNEGELELARPCLCQRAQGARSAPGAPRGVHPPRASRTPASGPDRAVPPGYLGATCGGRGAHSEAPTGRSGAGGRADCLAVEGHAPVGSRTIQGPGAVRERPPLPGSQPAADMFKLARCPAPGEQEKQFLEAPPASWPSPPREISGRGGISAELPQGAAAGARPVRTTRLRGRQRQLPPGK